MKYQKKPVVIDALRWMGNYKELYVWVRSFNDVFEEHFQEERKHADVAVFIKTLEGNLYLSEDAWIVRGIKGEYYPVRNNIFEATYEKAKE